MRVLETPLRASEMHLRGRCIGYLAETLEAFDVPQHVREAWLDLDTSMRDMVLNHGAQKRDDMLGNGGG